MGFTSPARPGLMLRAMKPHPAVPVEQLNLLRQQVILSQMRIMELEDRRDELVPKVRDLESLLAGAQSLADVKLEETTHLAKVLSDLQTEYAHLRHLQHVTNEALNDSRVRLEQTGLRLVAAEQRNEQLLRQTAALQAEAAQSNQALDRLGLQLAESETQAGNRLARVEQLDSELRKMKASRSWRWTAWLRDIERSVRGHRQP
jgi:chromosome segregation ATPase